MDPAVRFLFRVVLAGDDSVFVSEFSSVGVGMVDGFSIVSGGCPVGGLV